ncbi:MAG: DUF4040 domain-containing protein [Defluviitaleaceae bacterium]|nr:DUF4040 domain-containing protein [Defluviitaleaceae bacterium]
MTTTIMSFWLFCNIFVLFQKKLLSMILWLFLSSIIASLGFLFLGSPDVAMAEATASAFVTIIFIVCFENFFGIKNLQNFIEEENSKTRENIFKKIILPAFVVLCTFALFMNFLPQAPQDTYLKNLYILRASTDVGGQNVVGAIYLGYRVYDTIFEALLLLIAVVAVVHLSHFDGVYKKDGKQSEVKNNAISLFTVRIVAPITVLFGIYLIANGAITAGGGFQGGLAVASFFICRFLIFDIYDIPIKKVNKLEDTIFVAVVIMASLMVFHGFFGEIPPNYLPIAQNIYLFIMNLLIGIKVACGFTILLYRYVAIERN